MSVTGYRDNRVISIEEVIASKQKIKVFSKRKTMELKQLKKDLESGSKCFL